MGDSDHSKALRLDGRTALVTGGGTGLGRAFAQALAAAGASVIVAGRRREPLESAVAALRCAGHTARHIEVDVTDAASVDAMIAGCFEGGCCIDVLVNNAGLSRPGAALALETADWDAVLDTNLRGAFLVARSLAARLIERSLPGAIVNVCSVLGQSPQKGVAPYAVSKAGLLHLTRLLALEWARHRIRVNALVPGYLHTDITSGYLDSDSGRETMRRIPQRRLGEPAELTLPLLLLASDASSYMTGSQLVVDGGLSVNPL
jgi:NAD(P)-dependent dehydrogenase (short-subunit alcohol dehydrogenase family)